jgi:hypothetical protein
VIDLDAGRLADEAPPPARRDVDVARQSHALGASGT